MNLIQRTQKYVGLDLDHIIKNGAVHFVGQVLQSIFGLLFTVVLIRGLSQETYGQFQILMSVIGLLSLFALPGIRNVLVQRAAEKNQSVLRAAKKLSFKYSLIGSASAVLLAGYWYLFRNPETALVLLALAVFLPFIIPNSYWDALLLAFERFKLLQKYKVAQSIIVLLLVGMAVLLTQDLFVVAITYLVARMFTEMLGQWRSLQVDDQKNLEKIEKSYALKTTGIAFLGTALTYVDTIIVALLFGLEITAVYAAGSRLALQIKDFMRTLSALFTRRVVRNKTFTVMTHLKVFLVSAVIILPFIVVFEPLTVFLYGEAYQESALIGQLILCFVPFAMNASIANNHMIMRARKVKLVYIEKVLTGSVRAILLVVLTLAYGPIGLAFAVGLQYPVNLLSLAILSRKY